MTPWQTSRPLSRLTSSGSAKNGRILRPLSWNKGSARRPASESTRSEYLHDDSDHSAAPSRASARSRDGTELVPGEDGTFGQFNDNLDHVVLAIDKTRKSTIGASYYITRDGALYIMEDLECADQEAVNLCERLSFCALTKFSDKSQ